MTRWATLYCTNCHRRLQLWVAYAPCGSQHKDAVQVTLEQIDLIKRFVAQYPDHVRFANDSAALLEAHAEGRGASLISVESGHSIGTSLAVLRMFHRLFIECMRGVSYNFIFTGSESGIRYFQKAENPTPYPDPKPESKHLYVLRFRFLLDPNPDSESPKAENPPPDSDLGPKS